MTRLDTVETGSRKWIVAFGIALAPLLETIDSTIVNVALPDVQGNLGASLDEVALVGGIIVDNSSWPWIFYVNLIPGLISGTIAATMLKNPAEPRRVPVDAIGIALLAVGIAALEYVLEEGERYDWFADERIVWLSLTATVALVAFVVHSLRGTRHPIVDLRVLRDRNVAMGCVLAAGFGITLIGLNFILPQYLQSAIAFTPTLSGKYLLFRCVPVVTLAPAIGIALGANRFDPRLLIGFGFLATGLGTGWIGMMTTAQSDFGTLVWPLVLAGVGTAFLIIPLLTVVLAGVSNSIAPKASAFLTLSIQLGGSVSSAFAVTMLDRRESLHSDALASTATFRHLTLSGAKDPSTLAGLVGQQSAILSYADIAFVISALAFVLVPCVFIIRRPPPGPLSVAAE